MGEWPSLSAPNDGQIFQSREYIQYKVRNLGILEVQVRGHSLAGRLEVGGFHTPPTRLREATKTSWKRYGSCMEDDMARYF